MTTAASSVAPRSRTVATLKHLADAAGGWRELAVAPRSRTVATLKRVPKLASSSLPLQVAPRSRTVATLKPFLPPATSPADPGCTTVSYRGHIETATGRSTEEFTILVAPRSRTVATLKRGDRGMRASRDRVAPRSRTVATLKPSTTTRAGSPCSPLHHGLVPWPH